MDSNCVALLHIRKKHLFLLFEATLRRQLKNSELYRVWRECSFVHVWNDRKREREDVLEVSSRDK